MKLRIELKSNQYYDFFHIRKIWITTDFIEIEGNEEKGRKYRTIKLRHQMIDKACRKNLNNYMKKYMKRFDYEGICPYCESERIWLKQKQKHKKELNSPKPKYRNIKTEDINCECAICKKEFDYDQLMYSDKIMYY